MQWKEKMSNNEIKKGRKKTVALSYVSYTLCFTLCAHMWKQTHTFSIYTRESLCLSVIGDLRVSPLVFSTCAFVYFYHSFSTLSLCAFKCTHTHATAGKWMFQFYTSVAMRYFKKHKVLYFGVCVCFFRVCTFIWKSYHKYRAWNTLNKTQTHILPTK